MKYQSFKIEGSNIDVYTNGSGEVFVRHPNGVVLRISDTRVGFEVTASRSLMRPTSVNGLDAFKVTNWN